MNILLATVLFLAPAAPLPGAAPAPPPAPVLRSAEEILRDNLQALGGAKILKQKKTLRFTSQLSAKGMAITGTIEHSATVSGGILVAITLNGFGTSKQGSDGRVAWAEDPINGLRVLQGAEKAQARLESTWMPELQWRKLYQTVRAIATPATAPVGGDHECTELVPRRGTPAIVCFDARTHLRTFQQGVNITPQGEIPYTTTFSEWRSVAGVGVPFVQEIAAGPMTLQSRIVDIKFDERLDTKMFKLPKAPR
jgi:hypothetical protein